ncbi:hypothetical protein Q9R08_14320 [Microbacterium sp. QXD-8]|uniref:Uncharacterized protein n=1 Tax=Microbacterium psychrotolerans TaxID=3068321 RepID=A0ABU0Z5N1_9MICO|nr:hypothetical protein [Microbacterium sp. QXD-8]MDQ7879161.1 hypothetical protein [Microbacterium sp. QXD-8]
MAESAPLPAALPASPAPRPSLGIQGPVVAFQDPWTGDASDAIMRTGTGIPIPSQDPAPTPGEFVAALRELGADFYVHHVIPTVHDHTALLRDLDDAGIDVVLGNEYGNINGPYVEGTNRHDLPLDLLRDAAASGRLAGVLYDEPEHLQIHADQYRTDAHLPHFGQTDGLGAEEAIAVIDTTVRGIVRDVDAAVADSGGGSVPVLAEQVFPVMFHTLARAGMTPAPKVMKESFQPLQLATALGAARQYDRELWICADLWGPDVGPWLTRAPGFPGHSPAEFASALRLAYLFAPTRLFVENIDVLVRHRGAGAFERTAHGEVWQEFVRDFVPRHPLRWSHRDARADIALVHADDSDFGRGERPFGNRAATAPAAAGSVFGAWHALSHGQLPGHGSCLHIPGYDFPRHQLNGIERSRFPLDAGATEQTRLHGLFQATRNVLVFDELVRPDQLADAGLIVVAGSRLPGATLDALRARADAGATVLVAAWLYGGEHANSERVGRGRWIVYESFDDSDAQEAIAAHAGAADVWTQRFADVEVRIRATSPGGETLDFEIADAPHDRID